MVNPLHQLWVVLDDDRDLFINVNTELIDGTLIGNRLLIFLAPSGEGGELCPG